jgi:hypothetical protein
VRTIIAGSREGFTYDDIHTKMEQVLLGDRFPVTCVFCGGARGVDTFGADYAKVMGIPVEYHIASWEIYGKRAGFMRNEFMAANADALIAFWDGKSKGTKHMIDTAMKYGLWIKIFRK